MPICDVDQLVRCTSAIFAAYGVPEDHAHIVAKALADANLAGHDSHGVIRAAEYIAWLEQGILVPEAKISVVQETDNLAMITGNHGFGQVIGRWAMDIGIEKAKKSGFAIIGLNHSGHLGRMGDYPAMAVSAGLLSLHFINTHGGGKLVAPFGGSERRMSANPIAAGIPVRGGPPVIVDFSTAAIAGGKVYVAYNRGAEIPEGCALDRSGQPTTDPSDFVAGQGALMHFGGHKGFALGLLCDILAGALCGASCSSPESDRVANAMLTIILDPGIFRDEEGFYEEVSRYLEYVKSSALRPGFEEILYPGEPELRTAASRSESGIVIDDRTWNGMVAAGLRYGIRLDDYLVEDRSRIDPAPRARFHK
jgi:hydroxycarboxylate dehydrogenase B